MLSNSSRRSGEGSGWVVLLLVVGAVAFFLYLKAKPDLDAIRNQPDRPAEAPQPKIVRWKKITNWTEANEVEAVIESQANTERQVTLQYNHVSGYKRSHKCAVTKGVQTVRFSVPGAPRGTDDDRLTLEADSKY